MKECFNERIIQCVHVKISNSFYSLIPLALGQFRSQDSELKVNVFLLNHSLLIVFNY